MENINQFLFNREIEMSVLGAILNDEMLFNELESYPFEIFYNSMNQEIYKIMKNVKLDSQTIDLITMSDYVVKGSKVTLSYLSNVFASVVSTNFFQSHLNILIEYMHKRKIFKAVTTIDYTAGTEVISNELGKLLNEILSVKDSGVKTNEYLFQYIENLYNPKESKGIKLGLRKIDDQIECVEGGQLITIAAYTGIGKSIVTCQIILNILKQNKKIALFSLEMTREQIINKLVSNGASINFGDIKHKKLTDSEKEKVVEYTAKFLGSKHLEIYEFVDDINMIVKKIKQEKLNNDIDIVFIDLINRVSNRTEKTPNRAEFISSLTRRLKITAGQLNIPIVITAQINRTVESRQDKAPTLADIKESGGIAEDSDLVFGLYRDKKLEDEKYRAELMKKGLLNYHSKDATLNPECIEIHILKGRELCGSKNAFVWNPDFQRVGNMM